MGDFSTPARICRWYEEGNNSACDLYDETGRESLELDGIAEFGLDRGRGCPAAKPGGRVQLYRLRERFDQYAFQKEQQRGPDCTSHAIRSAIDMTRSAEILVHGEDESYYRRTATEPFYLARGHRKGGSSPEKLTRFAHEFGYLPRQLHTLENGDSVDLTEYNFDTANNVKTSTWTGLRELCRERNARRWIAPKSAAEVVDCLDQGWGTFSGQRIGFKRSANTRGVTDPISSRPRDSRHWNHAMATGGYDDTREIFSDRVFFIMNSWGRWNHKPAMWDKEVESILGVWIPGMIVVEDSIYAEYFAESRSIYSFADIDGYPQRRLGTWGMRNW